MIHLVEFVYQEHAWPLSVAQGTHERAFNEEVQGVKATSNRIPSLAQMFFLSFEEKTLQPFIELSDGFFFGDAFIALEPLDLIERCII